MSISTGTYNETTIQLNGYVSVCRECGHVEQNLSIEKPRSRFEERLADNLRDPDFHTGFDAADKELRRKWYDPDAVVGGVRIWRGAFGTRIRQLVWTLVHWNE